LARRTKDQEILRRWNKRWLGVRVGPSRRPPKAPPSRRRQAPKVNRSSPVPSPDAFNPDEAAATRHF